MSGVFMKGGETQIQEEHHVMREAKTGVMQLPQAREHQGFPAIHQNPGSGRKGLSYRLQRENCPPDTCWHSFQNCAIMNFWCLTPQFVSCHSKPKKQIHIALLLWIWSFTRLAAVNCSVPKMLRILSFYTWYKIFFISDIKILMNFFLLKSQNKIHHS